MAPGEEADNINMKTIFPSRQLIVLGTAIALVTVFVPASAVGQLVPIEDHKHYAQIHPGTSLIAGTEDCISPQMGTEEDSRGVASGWLCFKAPEPSEIDDGSWRSDFKVHIQDRTEEITSQEDDLTTKFGVFAAYDHELPTIKTFSTWEDSEYRCYDAEAGALSFNFGITPGDYVAIYLDDYWWGSFYTAGGIGACGSPADAPHFIPFATEGVVQIEYTDWFREGSPAGHQEVNLGSSEAACYWDHTLADNGDYRALSGEIPDRPNECTGYGVLERFVESWISCTLDPSCPDLPSPDFDGDGGGGNNERGTRPQR